MWLSVALHSVGGEEQRKGKEVKRRGGENHVWSPPRTALSFLGRIVFVSLSPLHVANEPAFSTRRRFSNISCTDSRHAAGGYLSPRWLPIMVSKTDDIPASVPNCNPVDLADEAGDGAQDGKETSRTLMKESCGCGKTLHKNSLDLTCAD